MQLELRTACRLTLQKSLRASCRRGRCIAPPLLALVAICIVTDAFNDLEEGI